MTAVTAMYTGAWLHCAQLERHTEERNYNYDRKEDREGSLVFQRPGGCCHRYTDAILSYLGFEIYLFLYRATNWSSVKELSRVSVSA